MGRGGNSGVPSPVRFLPLQAGAVVLLYSTLGWGAEATCDVEYGDKAATVVIKPASDPYEITSVEPGGDFRFAAQYLMGSNKLKTYVYHQSKSRYVLIHVSEYQITDGNCNQDENGMGVNKVYSAQLERELSFQCRVLCR